VDPASHPSIAGLRSSSAASVKTVLRSTKARNAPGSQTKSVAAPKRATARAGTGAAVANPTRSKRGTSSAISRQKLPMVFQPSRSNPRRMSCMSGARRIILPEFTETTRFYPPTVDMARLVVRTARRPGFNLGGSLHQVKFLCVRRSTGQRPAALVVRGPGVRRGLAGVPETLDYGTARRYRLRLTPSRHRCENEPAPRSLQNFLRPRRRACPLLEPRWLGRTS
jgi:hypothetical protein